MTDPSPGGARRTGLVLALVGGLAVVVLVAVVAVVLRDGDDGRVHRRRGRVEALDLGGGPQGEPEEEWTVAVPTAGDVDLASDGRRVYVTGVVASEEDEEDFATVVTAYDATDGEELWAQEMKDGFTSHPFRPVGDDQVLVSGYRYDTTALLDAATGEVVWVADGELVDGDTWFGATFPLGRGAPPGVVVLSRVDLEGDDDRISVVDRTTGEGLWGAAGDDAILCGDTVVTLEEQESDATDVAALLTVSGEITGRDATTGEELWSLHGLPGLCDGDEIAVGTDDDVTLVDVRTGDEGESFATPGVGTEQSIPSGDHVIVTAIDLTSEAGDVAHVAVHPRGGGGATFETDGFAVPVSDDLLIATDDEDGEVRLVRAADGGTEGSVEVRRDDVRSCTGALTLTTGVFCSIDSPEVTAHALTEGFARLWTIDAGAEVEEATVGGDRLFVVTEEGDLVGYR